MFTYIKELIKPPLKKTFHKNSDIMTAKVALKYLEAWIILLKSQMNRLEKMKFLPDWLRGPLKGSTGQVIWTDSLANFLFYRIQCYILIDSSFLHHFFKNSEFICSMCMDVCVYVISWFEKLPKSGFPEDCHFDGRKGTFRSLPLIRRTKNICSVPEGWQAIWKSRRRSRGGGKP